MTVPFYVRLVSESALWRSACMVANGSECSTGWAQPLMSKIHEFWNRSLDRGADFQVVLPWPR